MGKLKKLFLAVLVLSACMAIPTAAQDTIPEEALIVESGNSSGEQILAGKEQLESVENNKTGSIEITLTDGKTGTSKENIEFHCIKVAEIENGEYVLLDSFQNAGVDFNKIDSADELDTAASKLVKDSAKITAYAKGMTDTSGCLIFDNLEVGVYLLKAVDNFSYDTITPILIAIPAWSESEGQMLYDISVVPKHTAKSGTLIVYAPQTGLEDHTLYYLIAAVVCFSVAVLLVYRVKKSKQK